MVNRRISPFHAGAKTYSKESESNREDQKVFTEEDDADKNGWIAVILRIVQRHCVTKIGFDVIYGYICSYGYSATTAIFDN